MTEETKQSDARSRISDETLRQYLLCRLSEGERSEVDQFLLSDNGFAERVELAEARLIDDYVGRELEGSDQTLFVSKFLTTDARRQKLRLSSALQEYAGSQTMRSVTEPSRPSWFEAFSTFFSFKPTVAWTAAGSFAVLLLLLGLAWFLMRGTREQPIIARQEPAPASSPQPISSPAPIAAATQPSPPPQAKPTPEPAAPVAVASFVLVPGTLRSGGEMPRVAVPRGERDLVRLILTLENPAAATYQAELSTADGQTVAVKNNLRTHANQTRVTFDVPARLLQSADYQIKLSRKTDDQLETVGRYYFRALPE